ncbi:asparagine synthetase domain-containing protein 1-like [Oppia nitens]|uniref:asparagine synthetase domain-containing protein 1-like n=1 Tax=Oppia nitens TaxID=1686743 RepID=UPI0023DBD143|nr:asparagine synthetase domain-containing protein 1-like [Oppia nitens]
MCGIFACFCDHSLITKINNNESIRHFLCRRGPDQFAKLQIPVGGADYHSGLQLCLMSSVLQLRGGREPCDQPLMDSVGNVLQWNGQVFAGSMTVDDSESDTEAMMRELANCLTDAEMLAKLSRICGPWSFTYWDSNRRRFWFGRDLLGRRSLCWNTDARDQVLIISSISYFESEPAREWSEIPANGVYCLDLSADRPLKDTIADIRHYPWNRQISGTEIISSANDVSLTLKSPITVPLNRLSQPIDSDDQQIPEQVIKGFIEVLRQSLRRRCHNQQTLCKKCFARTMDDTENGLTTDDDGGELVAEFSSDSEGDILGTSPIQQDMLINKMLNSRQRNKECTHASTAILFSGGLDSTIIALLADECVPPALPIDLLNVAFDNDAPDRETGLKAWDELKALRPNRRWNFVSIYVSKEELQTMRDKHIKYLVKPSQTVLDDSIGCAIWFAANGRGLLMEEHMVTKVYETPARVVLLGMGADEQLAGYTRHRRVFDKQGLSGLIDEIALELDRLSSRNLGRDDRVASDHGREPRYPFLDEDVINFLNGIPVWHKCDLRLDRSTGEKLLLRQVADRLGLCRTSHHLKRAIQFGSRIAKIEEFREKGEDVCTRLTS